MWLLVFLAYAYGAASLAITGFLYSPWYLLPAALCVGGCFLAAWAAREDR